MYDILVASITEEGGPGTVVFPRDPPSSVCFSEQCPTRQGSMAVTGTLRPAMLGGRRNSHCFLTVSEGQSEARLGGCAGPGGAHLLPSPQPPAILRGFPCTAALPF